MLSLSRTGGWAPLFGVTYNNCAAESYGSVVSLCRVNRIAPYSDPFIPWPTAPDAVGFGPSIGEERALDTVAKYGSLPGYAALPNTGLAVDYIILKLQSHIPDFVFHSFEALVDEVDWTTSPGFPVSRTYKTKSMAFDDSSVYQGLLASLPEKDPVFLWTSFPKQEVIRHGKNTRQICGCDLRFLYYCLPLVHQFNKSLEVKGNGLPLYLGTSLIGDDLQVYVDEFDGCNFFLPLDASGFDTSIATEFLWLLPYIRSQFLPKTLHDRLYRLYDATINKLVVETDGVVFYAPGGVPSGHPSTAHDNSLLSWIYLITFLLDHYTIDEIEDCVAIAIYGDDVAVGFVEPPPFSVSDMKAFYKSYFGIVLKCPDDYLRDFGQLDFLSRYVRPIPHAPNIFFTVFVREAKLLASLRFTEAAVPCNPQSATAGLNSLPRICGQRDCWAGER
jgi:hypothetical protein